MSIDTILDEHSAKVAAIARAAVAAADEHARKRFEGIFSAYERALEDPNAKLPAYLHAAIEAARRNGV